MAYQKERNQVVASADFAKLGHEAIRQRVLRACSYELLFAYLVAVVANINFNNGRFSILLALVSTRTVGYTVASYLVGLAVLIVHAQLFQITRSPHSSHFPKLQRLLRSPTSTGTAIGAYVAMSYFMMVVHGWMFGGHSTRMWLYPEGIYGPPQLNPAWLASWVLATVLGCSYGAQLIMNERLQLSFPAIEQSRVYALKDRLPGGFSRALGFAFGVLWKFWIVYLLLGWFIYRSACGVLARVLTTSSYGMSNPLFSLSGLAFWLLSGTLTSLTWELAHRLFEIVATGPTRINELSLDRNACLLNGLKHTDSPLIQHLAYQELYRLTMFDAGQRMELLTDIDRPAGTMWKQVSEQCMGVIKTATDQLRAQNPAKESKASGPPKLTAKLAAAPVQARAGGAPMKDILLQNRKTGQAPTIAAAPARPAVAAQDLFGPEAQGLEKYVLTSLRDMLLQSDVGQHILMRSLRARSTTALSNFQQQVWAVRSLMRLVECSIREDSFGVVQKDIAMVLSTLFAYLAELERGVASHSDGVGSGDYTVQTTNRQALAMIQVVRNSLYTFTTSFYVYLEALKLPQDLGRQLQVFANFQA
ncbi:Nuclear pore complex subunit [Coemansia aciculifera]|nr:Nuclear pore complex subunit [Coemansia aciculifera]